MATSIDRRNSNVVMTMGSRKSAKQTKKLTMENLERVYGPVQRKSRGKNIDSPLPDRIQAAWNGSRTVAFTPEDWKPDVFSNAQSEFDPDEGNVRADAAAIRADLKRTLESALETLEAGSQMFFGLSATMLLHREATAFVSSLVERRVDILKTLLKSSIEQAKKPIVVARLLFNTGCNYLGFAGHMLRNVTDLVIAPVVSLWWQQQSRKKQELFLDEAAACPPTSPEERIEIGAVQSFFLSRLFAKFIVWFIDARFEILLDETIVLREFFDRGTQRSQKIAIAKAIFSGTEDTDLRPLLGILDVFDDRTIVKIFRAIRRRVQPLLPSRKMRALSSNVIGNLNAV